MKSAMVGSRGQPTSTDTARQAAISRTPEPRSRVTKKKTEPATWLAAPKRRSRNS